MRKVPNVKWLQFFILLPSILLSQKMDSRISLDTLIKEGLEMNPDLKASYHSWQSEQAKVPQAGALPDPTLSFNLMNMPVNNFDFNQEPMTGKQFAFMQMFPFPGKLSLREDVAEAGARVSQAKYDELRNQLKKQIALTYFDIFLVEKSLETIEKNKEVLRQFNRISETKYSVGRGLQQDVLKAQVELSKMEDKFITMQQKRESLVARMNALLNRAAGTHFGKPEELIPVSLDLNFENLKKLADDFRPLFKAWEATLQKSEKNISLAKRGYLPDFSLGVAYTQREPLRNGMSGVDFLSGMLNINVPLYFWKKQDKKVEESRYSQKMVREKYSDVRNRIYADLERILSDVKKNYRLLELYRDGIIPQATQSLNSALSGYQTDKVDFLTLLNNQITLFNFELDYYSFLTDYRKGLAELEAATGTSLHNK